MTSPKTGAEIIKESVLAIRHQYASLQPGDLDPLDELYYVPPPRLPAVLAEISKLRSKANKTQKELARLGKLVECAAFLAFRALSPTPVLRSWTGPNFQIDVLVQGNQADWEALFSHLNISASGRCMLVEAKGTGGQVDDPIFGRMCTLLTQNFGGQCGLGVFVTLSGAKGFRDRRKLGSARLRQIVFHASTRIPVVVFDFNDLLSLTKPGSLPRLLRAKIDDIQFLLGEPIDPGTCQQQNSLPEHLEQVDIQLP